MTHNINGLSRKQAEFLSHLAAQGKSIFSTEQAHAYWGEPAYTANILSRLVQKGWLQRLEPLRFQGEGCICCFLLRRGGNVFGLRIRM